MKLFTTRPECFNDRCEACYLELHLIGQLGENSLGSVGEIGVLCISRVCLICGALTLQLETEHSYCCGGGRHFNPLIWL